MMEMQGGQSAGACLGFEARKQICTTFEPATLIDGIFCFNSFAASNYRLLSFHTRHVACLSFGWENHSSVTFHCSPRHLIVT